MVKIQTFFTALADRTRRRILNLLRDQEICVCFFSEALGISQPKVSRHLAYLRNARIVEARRDGKWMYYRIIEPEDIYAAQILRETLKWLESEERMQKDYENLLLVRNSSDVPATIVRALKQNVLPEPHTSFQKKEEIATYLL